MRRSVPVLLLSAAMLFGGVGQSAAQGATVRLGINVGAAPVEGPVAPQPITAGVSYFHDQLAPYGRWVWIDGYDRVWHPYGVSAEWRPCTRGRWVLTDDGWTWVSSWPWGWAPFHYGRWAHDSSYGWVWVPGIVWAPAWVAWSSGDDWVGWAPLPPAFVWEAGVGFSVSTPSLELAIQPFSWCFVPERSFIDRDVGLYIAASTRNPSLLGVTRPFTDFAFVNGRIVNRGVPVDRIVRISGRPMPRFRMVGLHAAIPGHIRGHEMAMFRPRFAHGRHERDLAAPAPFGRRMAPFREPGHARFAPRAPNLRLERPEHSREGGRFMNRREGRFEGRDRR